MVICACHQVANSRLCLICNEETVGFTAICHPLTSGVTRHPTCPNRHLVLSDHVPCLHRRMQKAKWSIIFVALSNQPLLYIRHRLSEDGSTLQPIEFPRFSYPFPTYAGPGLRPSVGLHSHRRLWIKIPNSKAPILCQTIMGYVRCYIHFAGDEHISSPPSTSFRTRIIFQEWFSNALSHALYSSLGYGRTCKVETIRPCVSRSKERSLLVRTSTIQARLHPVFVKEGCHSDALSLSGSLQYSQDISHFATSSTQQSACSVEPNSAEDIAAIVRISVITY